LVLLIFIDCAKQNYSDQHIQVIQETHDIFFNSSITIQSKYNCQPHGIEGFKNLLFTDDDDDYDHHHHNHHVHEVLGMFPVP
jgi:hypothetical protein